MTDNMQRRLAWCIAETGEDQWYWCSLDIDQWLQHRDNDKFVITDGIVDSEAMAAFLASGFAGPESQRLNGHDAQGIYSRFCMRRAEDERLAALKEEQAARERATRLQSYVSLEKWKTLDDATKAVLLSKDGPAGSGFNRQDNESIEWARWSWNPITGCLHDCTYCYARDIASRFSGTKAYPHGFAPTLKPAALRLPAHLKPPKQAATDTRFKNVFCGSMADWFGRWVPEEWIKAVLDTIRWHPDWNFLTLTKFPKRLAEFEVPSNMWAGTSVDLQARVRNAEAAFANVNAAVRWLSVEPMLEPLRFNRLDLFHWIVIGGASKSSRTPAWQPPFEWIADLVRQAREAGVKVYFKTNLLGNRILELPADAPIERDLMEAPEVFRYLGKHPE